MYSLKHFKHLFPLFLTFLNIAATIVFTIIIVPHIKDINNVGLIRLSVRNIDRCAFGIHPSFRNNTAFTDLIHEDSNVCVIEQVDVIDQTLRDLSYLNKCFLSKYCTMLKITKYLGTKLFLISKPTKSGQLTH